MQVGTVTESASRMLYTSWILEEIGGNPSNGRSAAFDAPVMYGWRISIPAAGWPSRAAVRPLHGGSAFTLPQNRLQFMNPVLLCTGGLLPWESSPASLQTALWVLLGASG